MDEVELNVFFDPDGNPMSAAEWGAQFEDFKNRIVAMTAIENVTILTMWHGLVIPGRMGLFGTAALDEKERVIVEIAHWDTKDDALAGHTDTVLQIVTTVRETDPPPALHDVVRELARRAVK